MLIRKKVSCLLLAGVILLGGCSLSNMEDNQNGSNTESRDDGQSGSSTESPDDSEAKHPDGSGNNSDMESDSDETVQSAVNFVHCLDGYQPQKTEYSFYFNYKIIHPWWDAVALGMEDAVEQYKEQGIRIYYEYLAPKEVSADYQIQCIREAAALQYDCIGVDVSDIAAVTPVINELIEDGRKVMTFSSSDASRLDGCERLAYVGNTHNYEDGAALTEALCQALGYEGEVAVLVGSEGAPCHEDRALGAIDVLGKYPGMSIAEIAYDEDSVENAYALTKGFLQDYPNLAGIICCNMSNPVGAARAVREADKTEQITIVGMDHDREALHYLADGTIYALGVQDCYSIGFDTIQVAVKLSDGVMPSDTTYPEMTEESTTIIYQDGAWEMLKILYGETE